MGRGKTAGRREDRVEADGCQVERRARHLALGAVAVVGQAIAGQEPSKRAGGALPGRCGAKLRRAAAPHANQYCFPDARARERPSPVRPPPEKNVDVRNLATEAFPAETASPQPLTASSPSSSSTDAH